MKYKTANRRSTRIICRQILSIVPHTILNDFYLQAYSILKHLDWLDEQTGIVHNVSVKEYPLTGDKNKDYWIDMYNRNNYMVERDSTATMGDMHIYRCAMSQAERELKKLGVTL